MQVTIIGAGAIGGLAGAYMSLAGHEVLLVDRWVEHVAAMNANGLSIDGVRGTLRVPVRAVTPDCLPSALGAVLVATKSQHTLDAIRQILPSLGKDSYIVSFQNGFNEPDIQTLLNEAGLPGSSMVIGSIPNYGGALVDPAHIEFVHEGPIQLGELDGRSTPRIAALAEALGSLTVVQLTDNVWGQIWSKEVYSAQVVFSALVDARVHETLGIERWARVAGAIVREALEIAEANGITVPAFDFFDPANYKPETAADTRRLLDNVQHAIWLLKKDQKPGQHQFKKKGSGIWWDIVYRNRPSEVRASNGKLVEYGRRVGADVRLNEKLCDMIYQIECGERALGFHNFEELEAFVAASGRSLP